MNEAKKNELYDRYENSTHLLGRLGTAAAILLLLAVPMAMGWVLNASPTGRPSAWALPRWR